jgi:hypothetical protein
MKTKGIESPLPTASFIISTPLNTIHFCRQIRQREGQIKKDGLQISPHDQRRSRVLREGLEMNSDNTIPGQAISSITYSLDTTYYLMSVWQILHR